MRSNDRVSTEKSTFTPSRLIVGDRVLQALKVDAGFQLRLLEAKVFQTPAILFEQHHLVQLGNRDHQPVEIGSLMLQQKHPHVSLFFEGELWLQVELIYWGMLLGSQTMGQAMEVRPTVFKCQR